MGPFFVEIAFLDEELLDELVIEQVRERAVA